jgi:hypothetical protein
MNLLVAAKRFLSQRSPLAVWANRAAGLILFTVVMVLLVELFAPAPSQATLPVIDLAAVSQMIQQTEQYAQNLERMTEQILLLKQQVQSLTGHYGMGSLGGPVNGWGTTSWQDIANMVNTGINPGDAAQVSAYKSARADVVSRFPPLDPSLQTTNPRMNAAMSNTYSSAITGMSSGEGTFNSLTTQLAELQILKNKIETTSTLKAAVDLNTAVAVKSAQINAEVLRTNAVQLYLQGNSQNTIASGQAAQAEFFAN